MILARYRYSADGHLKVWHSNKYLDNGWLVDLPCESMAPNTFRGLHLKTPVLILLVSSPSCALSPFLKT